MHKQVPEHKKSPLAYLEPDLTTKMPKQKFVPAHKRVDCRIKADALIAKIDELATC